MRRHLRVIARGFAPAFVGLLVGCGHAALAPQPPVAPTPRILNLDSVMRLPPVGSDSQPPTESYDSQEMFGSITEFDSPEEETTAYSQQQRAQARELGIDFCDWQIPGYRLHRPCEAAETDRLASQSVAYGDFDGDGKADAFGHYEADGVVEQGRSISLVWFGGESAPRAFRDFTEAYAKKGTRYTEKNIESAMITKVSHQKVKISGAPSIEAAAPLTKPVWHEYPFLISRCNEVARPLQAVVGNVNQFRLQRAILGITACNLAQTIIVFSKSRDRILSAQASTM